MTTIAGVLSVRVIAGRKIKPVLAGSLLRWQTDRSNPFVTVRLDQKHWKSSVVRESLQPNWGREQQCDFEVPLPDGRSGALNKKKSAEYSYDSQHPQVEICIFHQDDEAILEGASTINSTTTGTTAPILIGSSIYSILQVITNSSSSTKEWIPVYLDGQCTGQVLVAFHYDAAGKDPSPGDCLRVAQFGGEAYFCTLLPSSETPLQVVDVQGDRVSVSFKSTESWKVQLEFPRNLIHVMSSSKAVRPLCSRHSTAIDRMEFLSATQRMQLNQAVTALTLIATKGWAWCTDVVSTYQLQGVGAMVQSSAQEGHMLVVDLYREIRAMDWTGAARAMDEHPAELKRESTERDEEMKEELAVLSDDDDCPPQLICPITGCRMKDPVVAADGHSYDRVAILHWFSTKTTSPMTGATVTTTQVFTNYALLNMRDQ